MDLVHAPFVRVLDEVGNQSLADLAGVLEARLLGGTGPLRRVLTLAEGVEGDRPTTDEVGNDLLALGLEGCGDPLPSLRTLEL